MSHHLDLIKSYLDVFVVSERASQVVEILLLVLSAIHDFWSERSLVVAHVLAHDDLARDNQSIVAIHVSQRIQVLLIIITSEILHKLQDFHAAACIGDILAIVHDVVIYIVAQCHVGTSQQTVFRYADGQLLVQLALVACIGIRQGHRDTTHLIAIDRRKTVLGIRGVVALEVETFPQIIERRLGVTRHVDRRQIQRAIAIAGTVDCRQERRYVALYALLDRGLIDAALKRKFHALGGQAQSHGQKYIQNREFFHIADNFMFLYHFTDYFTLTAIFLLFVFCDLPSANRSLTLVDGV